MIFSAARGRLAGRGMAASGGSGCDRSKHQASGSATANVGKWPVGLYARHWPLSRVPGWSVAGAMLYRSVMTASGHWLRVLGVAIVLIAVQLMPSPARAHGGHAHAPSAVAVHHHHHHHHGSAASLPSQAVAPAVAIAAAGEWRAAPRDSQTDVVNCGGCVTGCCGNGAGCCGAALAAAPPASPPPLPRALGRALETSSPDPGAEPDGLRRPPRPFA